MRKLLGLAALGAIVYWFLNRGTAGDGPSATIGYGDGSAVTLDRGSPELDRIAQIAAEALDP